MASRKEFLKIIENTPIAELNKESIRYLLKYYKKKHNPKLTSRSFIFLGEPGLGKTYLAKELVRLLGKETLYMGCSSFNHRKAKRFKTLQELVKEVNADKEQVIFLDDLNYLFEKENCEMSQKDKRSFMEVLNAVKENPKKLLIATANYLDLDEQMIDRLEVKIYFTFPDTKNKKSFLEAEFSDCLSKNCIETISESSMGYNYRDLPEMIKLAYRIGKSKLTNHSLSKAAQKYKPTQIYSYKIENGISLRFKDIIGKQVQKAFLSKIVHICRNKGLQDDLGLKRHNLLLFHGPPGTGKTYMTRALAGELGFPMICVSGKEICSEDSIEKISRIIDFGKRYQNCIIFIDEAEKSFGNASYGEDNYLMGEFNRLLDGINEDEIKSLFILAVNDSSRLGYALKDRLVHLEFPLPDFNERKGFIERKMQLASKEISRCLNSSEMANLTSEMSFRDIERLWNDVVFFYLDNKNVDMSFIQKKIMELNKVSPNALVG